MDFRYKSELNEFFIHRENLEEISRIKINKENNEKNPILTPILMKYGKIFYLVFQIQEKGIYGIEVNNNVSWSPSSSPLSFCLDTS